MSVNGTRLKFGIFGLGCGVCATQMMQVSIAIITKAPGLIRIMVSPYIDHVLLNAAGTYSSSV